MTEKTKAKPATKPHAKPHAEAKQRLEAAYDTMLGRVKEQLDDLGKKAEPMVDKFVVKAKQKAISLGELSESEAEQIGQYLARDLQEAAVFLKDAKRMLADWLYFDYKLIEEKFWDTYSAVAAQVKVEWTEFNQRLSHTKEYNAGEIVGVGTLECAHCKEAIHYAKSTTITKCPQCGGSKFARKA